MWSPITKQLDVVYEADTVDTDGNGKVVFLDKTGNGYHQVQADTTKRMTLVTNILNGQAVLEFDGINDKSSMSFGQVFAQPNTMVVVYKNTGAAATPAIMIDGLTSTNRNVFYQYSGLNRMWASSEITYSKTSPYSSFISLYGAFNTTSSKFYENNILKASGTVGSYGIDGITLGTAFDGTYVFQGQIAAVYFSKDLLTNSEKNELNNYIYNKFGVSTLSTGMTMSPSSLVGYTNNPNGITSTITWNQTDSIVSVVDDNAHTLVLNTEYSVFGNTFTLLPAYSNPGSSITITPDFGDPLVIPISTISGPALVDITVGTTPEVISPNWMNWFGLSFEAAEKLKGINPNKNYMNWFGISVEPNYFTIRISLTDEYGIKLDISDIELLNYTNLVMYNSLPVKELNSELSQVKVRQSINDILTKFTIRKSGYQDVVISLIPSGGKYYETSIKVNKIISGIITPGQVLVNVSPYNSENNVYL